MSAESLAYIDASAFVKLVAPEPETSALARALASWARVVSSEILEVEVMRAARRRGVEPVEVARGQLARVRLLPLDARTRHSAGEIGDAALRTLDAIHLATAVGLAGRCGAFFAYDRRLSDAARALGLAVQAPADDAPVVG